MVRISHLGGACRVLEKPREKDTENQDEEDKREGKLEKVLGRMQDIRENIKKLEGEIKDARDADPTQDKLKDLEEELKEVHSVPVRHALCYFPF